MCAECVGAADNCTVCSSPRVQPPYCVCPANKISDSNGNCVDNVTCAKGEVLVSEGLVADKSSVVKTYLSTVC